jgi:hypothetical protein
VTQVPATNSPDEALIFETVKRYVDGVLASDAKLVESSFRDDARMWGYLGPNLLSAPLSRFYAVVSDEPRVRGWEPNYRSKIHSLVVVQDIASVVLEEFGYLGSDFYNVFTLIKEGGDWLIASKTFYLTAGLVPQ